MAGLTSAPQTAQPNPRACFHCGLPVPDGANYPVVYRQQPESACCRGCQVVAQTIIDSGQGAYYEHRTALPPTPQAAAEELQNLGLYDLPEIQKSFVRVAPDHVREASLILENIVCAACIWLNERHIAQLPGVLSVDINYSTRRARVRWDETRIHLSEILKAVTEIGYIAHPFDTGRQEEIFRKERNSAIKRLAIAGLGMMQVMMYAIPTYTADPADITPDILALMRWASLILTLPVVLYSAGPFFTGAWRDLKRHTLGMDVPLALGVGSAFMASMYATIVGHGEVYFDSVAMFVFLLLTGRFLEMSARRRSAQAAEELVKLIPPAASRLPQWPGREQETIPAVTLAVGDYVLVKPGETVPADGLVVEGRSRVNEAMLTGESMPIAKTPGDGLIGGSVNQDSPVVMRVSKVGEETRLSAIIRLLDRAQSEKPRIGKTADQAAAWFVGALLVVTGLIAVIWYVHDPSRALWITVSVLVITCPCALGLATPAALTAATGRLTKLGLLTTRGHALETLAQVTDLVLDKTGTLTHGQHVLLKVHPAACISEEQALALAAGLESGSEHPLARSIRAACPAPSRVENPTNYPGRGVQGTHAGQTLRLGKPGFVQEWCELPPPPLVKGNESLLALGADGQWLAWITLGDTVRIGAVDAIQQLRRLGLRLHLLSGDSAQAAEAVAHQLGIAEVRAEALPDDKLSYIKQLQSEGRIVAMVGDGINDAPVLAAAQVSIAMGEGTDVAQAAADMVMLGGRLSALAEGVSTARKTRTIIRQNLGWALAYNLIAIPAAGFGYVTPWIAGIGMSASSLLVVLNALRLADFNGQTRKSRAIAPAQLMSP
ncbi:MAG TPA: heavy metal translocating P-type ATPase [Thiobacillaceae bacterium]|nr:heavy metal translocating P-type ATPase [Thiobacillaceae bacterium]